MAFFNINTRIYYEDVDLGGIVYYANYLRYMERGRTELLRDMGVEQFDLKEKTGSIFVVRRLSADYLQPAFYDDWLTVKTGVKMIKNTSFLMKQEIWRSEDKLFEADISLVHLNASFKPARVDKSLIDGLSTYMVK